jgi:hypothetical protein
LTSWQEVLLAGALKSLSGIYTLNHAVQNVKDARKNISEQEMNFYQNAKQFGAWG